MSTHFRIKPYWNPTMHATISTACGTKGTKTAGKVSTTRLLGKVSCNMCKRDERFRLAMDMAANPAPPVQQEIELVTETPEVSVMDGPVIRCTGLMMYRWDEKQGDYFSYTFSFSHDYGQGGFCIKSKDNNRYRVGMVYRVALVPVE